MTRALRLWLIALNVGLILTGVWLAAAGTGRMSVLVTLLPLIFAPFAYARLRLHRALAAGLSPRRMRLIGVLGMGLDAVMVAQLLTARGSDAAAWLNGAAVAWIGPVWFSTYALLFLGYAALGLARTPHRLLRLARPRPRPRVQSELAGGGPLLARRDFLRQYGVVGAAAPFAISLSGVPLSYHFRVDRHEIQLPNWPRALDGLRVAHLSDIHVGGGMDRSRLREVVALTQAARPDLILHTGDFLTHRSGEFDAPLYEALAQLDAPHGQWACLGNHDFDDPERLTHRLAGAGVTVLRNRVVRLAIDGQPLELAGVDFLSARADGDAYRRVAGAWPRPAAPRLLLAHDPRAFATLPDGCADLVLSGHTHGGHIGIQLGPEHAITVVGLAGIPDQGVFRRGDMRLFVTRCVGFYGYPMRLGIPPEIALLVLRAPRATTTPL